MEKLKLNHRYLVRLRPCSSISELTIIEITQTSIKVKYHSGNTWWYHKELDKFWEVIEDLGFNDDDLKPNRPTNPSCTTVSG